MEFTSITEVKKYFNVYIEDIDELKLKIVKERNTYHPDKTGGEFLDGAQKEKYFSCQNALDYLDSYKLDFGNRETEISKIIEQNKDLMNKLNELNSLEERVKRYEESMSNTSKVVLKKYRSQLLIPRLTSSGIFGFLTFILTLPKIFKENIMNSNIYGNEMFLPEFGIIKMLWVIVCLYTMMLWILYWVKENQFKLIVADLSLEVNQNKLFNNYMENNEGFIKNNIVTKDDFVNYVNEYELRRYRRYLGDVIYNVADIVFEKAENKGIIRKINKRTLNDQYEFIIDDSEDK